MSTNSHNAHWSGRLGRAAGRAWRGYRRQETRTAAALSARGIPAAFTRVILWVGQLAVLAMLLYAAFWVTLLVAVVLVVLIARNQDDEDEASNPTEWRYGSAGYGLYTSDEHRIDPHDPEDEQP
ncbi:Protein of unknown function [Dyella jiangningensis]|jgi:hypothetical protein|uniref:DUF3742 family protein n=1 Tax=Pseudomonadota TaxID=1224 RepID=UPI0008887766|nr:MULTISPECIES: DUF3742 family protein [Pseudomonadota]PXV59714.1 uncharacterized protein DUF3742 [Dyella sp. AtDHG13]UCF22778.1 MAG: DUF3742 family protein [Ralstonia sp.]SDJ26012.1 Protein of unknown function [Dyella jiangningensis]